MYKYLSLPFDFFQKKKKWKKINQIFNIVPFYYQTSIIVQIVGSIYLELDWVPHHWGFYLNSIHQQDILSWLIYIY